MEKEPVSGVEDQDTEPQIAEAGQLRGKARREAAKVKEKEKERGKEKVRMGKDQKEDALIVADPTTHLPVQKVKARVERQMNYKIKARVAK